MVEVYVTLIIKGAKQIEQVPDKIRAEVQESLIAKGYPELAGD